MKFSSREKNIMKIMFVVVTIGGLSEVGDRYFAMKKRIKQDIQTKRDEITTYMEQLTDEDPQKYLDEVNRIEEALFHAREKVVELATEAEASLLVRQSISESAEDAGVTINSISSRKSKNLSETEQEQLKELRTYFGYDTDLESLLHFFSSFEEKPYYMVIESLSISARRRPVRRTNVKTNRVSRNRSKNIPKRKPLNGNAILATLYLPNPNGSIDQYEVSSTAKAFARDTDPETREGETDEPVSPEILLETGEATAQTPARLPGKDKSGEDEAEKEMLPMGLDRAKKLPSTKLETKPKPLTGTATPTSRKRGNIRFDDD